MTFKTRKIQPRKTNHAAQPRKNKKVSTQNTQQKSRYPKKRVNLDSRYKKQDTRNKKISNFKSQKPKIKKSKSQITKLPNYQTANKKQVQRKKQHIPQSNSLRIIPLGGCEEVGRNMTIFEYKNDIVIIDMGLQFPEEDQPGIDYIIPNTEYLKGKEKNIRGVIFTHGHLDHIGAAPILLEKLNNPMIIGGKLTLHMIKARQEDYKKDTSKKLKTYLISSYNKTLTLGKFKVKFFPVSHSIMDSMGVIIESPSGTAIHPGDWNVEHDAAGINKNINYKKLSRVKKPSILMLESLGATNTKTPVPEKEMYKNIENIIKHAPGRVIIGTFSSMVERIKIVLEMAEKYGRKVAVDGFSMKSNVKIAKELGYIKFNLKNMVDIKQTNQLPDNKVVAIVTGAQGEENAVLNRIVNGDHRFIKLQKNDTIIFSSSVIPGNERSVQKLKDAVYRQCDNVIHSEIMNVHTSGHATIDDYKKVIKQVKPTYFMPVYANHYMLKEAGKLAQQVGYKNKDIIIPDNGSVVEVNKTSAKILPKKINTDPIMVDGLGVSDLQNVVLRDRQILAEQGMVVVISTLKGKSKKLAQKPDVISRGFVYLDENKSLITEAKKKVQKIIEKTDSSTPLDEKYLKNKIRNDIGQFLFSKTGKRPMVLPVIIEV